MKISLITEYPGWFIVFCLLAGLAYSCILYYKESKLSEVNKWLITAMALLRFFAVSILAFLLLSPLLQSLTRDVQKSIIIIAQDNSSSILSNKDSAFYKNDYKKAIDNLVSDLNDKYEIRQYAFGEKLSEKSDYSFNEKQTDISNVFDEIQTRFSNRNIGAVILASDGIYNKGLNPVYSSSQINVPVYAIALGDTSVKKDIILNRVVHNRLAYLGNSFPLEVYVDARQVKGKASVLTVSKGKEILFSKNISFTSDQFSQTIPVLLEAKQTGLQRYNVRLSSVAGEASVINNKQDVFIDVIDAREKILILSDAPHPDVAALKLSIESNKNYEVDAFTIDEYNQAVNKYDLIILNQLPSSSTPASKVLSEINKSAIPVLYIIGGKSAINSFNTLQTGLTINAMQGKTNDVEAAISESFPLFTVSDNLKKVSRDFPALQSPFGKYNIGNSASVLFTQKIGSVQTQDPLIVFNQQADKKTATIIGEGIWRWRLRDYAINKNHDAFNELVSKTIQYLSVKTDKSFFRINAKKNFDENEPVEFEAEVYNESYELINVPDVTLTISNEENKKFPFTFSKTSNAYRLNAGLFPVGEYKYEGKVKVGDKIYTQRGEFSVSPITVEITNTVADHQLLFTLAKKHDGELIYPSEINKLSEILQKREDIKSVSYTENKLTDLINLKWVFFLLVLLLAAEWFMRKRNGYY